MLLVLLGLLAGETLAAPPAEQPSASSSEHALRRAAPLNAIAGSAETGAEQAEVTDSLVSLFSTDDYPKEAIRKNEQGIVEVRLTVGPDGAVADCEVTGSSGSPSLDVQTCRILWTRARFRPALDARGRPVKDTYRQRVRWELPAATPAEVESQFSRFIIRIDDAMAITGCRVETSLEHARLAEGCPMMIETAKQLLSFAPALMEFRGRELVFETRQQVGEFGGLAIGEEPGETAISLFKLDIAVNADGKVTDCSMESWGPIKPTGKPIDCEAARARPWKELPKEATNRGDRRMTVITAAYLRRP